MNKYIVTSVVAAALAVGTATAQSFIDGYTLSQSEMRGTARFMSMGGAFTALGGDLSTLTQNPAGLGIYRSSEIGVTLDISARNFSTTTASHAASTSQTKAYCNNFGYIGATRLKGTLKSIAWGVSYNRAMSFDRVYSGYQMPTSTSLSNYIAYLTQGTPAQALEFGELSGKGSDYDPYWDSYNKDGIYNSWLSVLGYSSWLINPTALDNTKYNGLHKNGTTGDALFEVRERGYIDEYNIDFGGNILNTVYWGLGVGINDLSYTRDALYSESMENVEFPGAGAGNTVDAGFDLNNHQYVTGTGYNFKFGVIVKPINQLRFGAAIHTPTYYSLTKSTSGTIDYSYSDGGTDPLAGNEYTDVCTYDWRLRSPWRFMLGVAGVLGNKAIISLDYERQAYNDMKIKVAAYGNWGDNFVEDTYLTENVHQYLQASNIVRIGVEYRVTPQFSLRAGYNYATTNVSDAAEGKDIPAVLSGDVNTDPSYTLNKNTQHISVGLGYRYKGFYIDGAYVYKRREATYHAFTDFDNQKAPTATLAENIHSAVISVGYKF